MRLSIRFAAGLAGAACVWSALHGEAAALGKVDDPVLPLKISGYELRVLDRRKPIVFQVGESKVEASLPIFIYIPTAGCDAAGGPLRRAYAELQQLGRKPEWTAYELRQVLADLDVGLRNLEGPAAPPPLETQQP